MTVTFNTHGNEKQKSAARAWIDSGITDIVYGGGKGGGKTFLGCSLIFTRCAHQTKLLVFKFTT